jgi:hypothetical protein
LYLVRRLTIQFDIERKDRPMPHRRTLLTAAAGLLLTGEGGLWRVARATTAPDPVGPWRAAPAVRHADPRLNAAAWAVLAPNPHNRQPWLMRMEGADAMSLFCDLDRRLPETDPFDRQILIGLGAFLELFRLALLEQGWEAAITPFPEGEPQPRLGARPVARVVLRRGGAPDPLFAAAPARRSAKLPYDTARPVEEGAIAALRGALLAPETLGAETQDVARLKDIAWRAWLAEAQDAAAWGESVALMRLGSAAVAAQPDGISLWGPQMDGMVGSGQLTRAAMAPGQPGWQFGFVQYRAIFEGTNAFVWQVTRGNTRAEQLLAGRDWLRLNLAATAAGLAVQPVSQALQEFPAMVGPYGEIHALLGQGGTVQMLARLGHPLRAAPPTPRWPAESRILPG